MNAEKLSLHSKKDFQDLMLGILGPLKSYYSAGKGILNVGDTCAHYELHTSGMEAFARPLWGLVPYWAGGGREGEFESIYQSGLASGTDPDSADYWGGFRHYDQLLVEMAALGYGILMAPEVMWDPLSEPEKANLVKWLGGINEYECCENNWQFFCILVNVALRSKGYPYSEERLQLGLDRIDSYYRENGWYQDGAAGQYDYYIGFAIHFYSLIYSKFMEDVDPERCCRYRERAGMFAKDFIYWFAEDGQSVAYGRSLTYRFAQVSFFAACVWAELDVFPVEVYKGIISRHLQSWMEAPIFDHGGILTIGYRYPNLHMCEDYNAPGSPYWCMKAFVFLALPDDHPFWSAAAAPLPDLEPVKTLGGDMVAQRYGGEAVLYVPGCWQDHRHHMLEAKYSKFAYCSQFGFNVSISGYTLREVAADSMLIFEIDGHYFVRDIIDSYRIEDEKIITKWSPFKGIAVETTIIPTSEGHRRVHKINSSYECRVYDTGFAVAKDERKYYKAAQEGSMAQAENDFSFCRVSDAVGLGEGLCFDASPNTNLLFPKTVIPAVTHGIKTGESQIVTDVKFF